MSASLDPNSADSEPEKSQVQPLSWPSIIFDESKMEEIGINKDNPPQIIEVAKALLKVSGGIKYVQSQSHKEDFERIIGRASILVIALLKSYKKSKGQSPPWPTLKLKIVIGHLIDTVHRTDKLLKRKFKNTAKRFFGAYVVRDLGKFKKYEGMLDSVREDFEKLSNIKVSEVMQEVLGSQAQNLEPSDEENTETRADIPEIFTEGNSQRDANAAAAEPTSNHSNLKIKSEKENVVVQTKSKDSEKTKQDGVIDPKVPHFNDTPRSEKKGNKNETTTDEVAREVTSFAANRAGWAKDRLSEISELSSGNEDVPARAPTTGPTKVDQTRFKDLKNGVTNNNNPEVQYFKDTHRSEKKGKKNETTIDEDAREAFKLSEVPEDKLSSGNEDVPSSATPTGPTKVDQTRLDTCRSEKNGKEKETTIDEDAREVTSAQGFATNRAGWMKDRLSEVPEGKLSSANEDVPASAPTGPTRVDQTRLDTRRNEKNAKGKETKIDEDAKEATSAQGFATNRTGWIKDRLSEVPEGKLSSGNEDLPTSVITAGPTRVDQSETRLDTRRSEKKGKEKETTIDEDAREAATSAQSFVTNRAGWMKDKLREVPEGELSSDNKDVPASATTTGPTRVDQTSRNEKKGKEKETKTDEDAREATTSAQGFATNRAGWMKDRLSEIPEVELNSGNEDAPARAPPITGPTNERKPTTTTRPVQNERRKTTPVAQRQATISVGGVSGSNHGTGTVTTKDSGNITNSNISNVGNNNSENHYRPTGRFKKKKPTRKNARRDTAPAGPLQSPVRLGGLEIQNYGSGNVSSSNVGNLDGTSISNVGNDNSKNYY